MRIKDGFLLREVCGEKVIVGEGLGAVDFGKLLVLNETAAWLWEAAREMSEFTSESIAERLCEEYDVSDTEAKADVAEILNGWKEMEIIE